MGRMSGAYGTVSGKIAELGNPVPGGIYRHHKERRYECRGKDLPALFVQKSALSAGSQVVNVTSFEAGNRGGDFNTAG